MSTKSNFSLGDMNHVPEAEFFGKPRISQTSLECRSFYEIWHGALSNKDAKIPQLIIFCSKKIYI